MDTFICTSTLIVWILTISSGFVLISSANEEIDLQKTFEPSNSLVYQWRSTVLLDEYNNGNGSGKNVGFSISADVHVDTVWGNEKEGDRVIQIRLQTPTLHIKSRSSPNENGFAQHASNLENMKNSPFIVVWNKGKIKKIFVSEKETKALVNIQKGIASLLQVQSSQGRSSEIDASGQCKVDYKIVSSKTITKEKSNCVSENFGNEVFVDEVLGLDLKSKRDTMYELDTNNRFVNVFLSRELHELKTKTNKKLHSVIEAEQAMRLKEQRKCDVVKESTLEKVLNKLAQRDGIQFVEQTLKLTKDSPSETQTKFTKVVESQRANLKSENLGSVKSAKAFLVLITSAKTANKEDISKALNSKKNKEILEQLCDALGYAQTKDTHNAVMKILHLDSDEKLDLVERYLWALSLSPHPNVDILQDLLNKYKKYTSIPKKIKHTLVLSIASMARNLDKIGDQKDHDVLKVLNSVEETILNELDYSKGEEKFIYFGALKNLHSPTTIATLTDYIKKGTLKEEVLAWKTIKSFDRSLWAPELLKMAEKSLFQLDKLHDSSARTLAADMILESDISQQKLEDLLLFVISNETNYEIKQYVFQTIKMKSDNNESFKQLVETVTKNNPHLNNYSGLSPRGVSTALKRDVFKGSSLNGSFVSVQEIKSGIVKRGAVDVIVDKDGKFKEIFSLGIFTDGLSSFVSSDENEESSEEEKTTAGMELTILGTQIRPFVFFDGQGELMGHVWSGTASELTTAFQANILLQDYSETIALGNGFFAQFNLMGAASFDLSGKIEVSLWSRNAEALIEKSAGYLTSGHIKLDSPIVKTMVEFNAAMEPKLSLQINADFSSGVKLCMRLFQPDTLFRFVGG